MSRLLRTIPALATLLGGVLAVLLFAPARWLADGAAHASGGRVQLPQARGTVWAGQSGLLLSGGEDSQARAALPDGISWTMSPGWHSGPVLHLQLSAPCCTPQGIALTVKPGLNSLNVTMPAHQSQWPASLLMGLGTPWNTLQLQAELKLATSGFGLTLTPSQVLSQGDLTLDLSDASSRLSTIRPMGSYRLTWRAAPTGDGTLPRDNGRLELTTLQGALQLQGSGQWVAGRLRFEGQAEASPGREEALANLMNLLGRRQGPRTLIKIG